MNSKHFHSENDLIKSILCGSYEIQHGDLLISNLNQFDDKKTDNFERVFMANPSSVKKLNTNSTHKSNNNLSHILIDHENVEEANEISNGLYDNENNKANTSVLNSINSSSTKTANKLTLTDMINETLPIDLFSSMSRNIEENNTRKWFIDKQNESKINKHTPKLTKPYPIPFVLQPPKLPINIKGNDRLLNYINRTDVRDESNTSTKSTIPNPNLHRNPNENQSIPHTDLEQIFRSLTVDDLKDELIREKIYELKLLIDSKHKIPKYSIPSTIQSEQEQQLRRRTIHNDLLTFFQSNDDRNYQIPYNYTYDDIIFSYNNTFNEKH